MNDHTHLDDEGLLKHIRTGDHDAFSELVTRHSKKYYNVAYRFLGQKQDAEDIVQDAFLKLWERPEIWNPGKQAKFTTWFYRVVVNMSLDYNKKFTPSPLPDNSEIADNQPMQDDLLDRERKDELLETYIAQLPQRQKTALNLCFYEGVSNKEAAQIIGVNIKALQSLIMRAKSTLKVRFKRHIE